MALESEDRHFLIDNASPPEVELTLRVITGDSPLSTEELRRALKDRWNFRAQRNLTFTTRRLIDLGAAQMVRTASGKPGYVVTPLGERLRAFLVTDAPLYKDILHCLHYDGFDGSSSARKVFWSYLQCCDIVWNLKRMPPDEVIVAEVQARIDEQYPLLYQERVGGNFNKGGVSSGWRPWILQLEPSPFPNKDRTLIPRVVTRYELALLALDRVYRQRGYRYGDPVLLDDRLLDEIAAVFFLDLACCRELLERAARLDRALALRSTFAGTSLTLQERYTIERL